MQKTVVINDEMPNLGLVAGAVIRYNDAIANHDDGMAFVVSQLAAIDPKAYEKKYGDIIFMDLVPIDTSIPEWADTYTYTVYDMAGMGAFINSNSMDIPSVSMGAKTITVKMYDGAVQSDYSLGELRSTSHLGMPISTQGLKASHKAFLTHAQSVAFHGDQSIGAKGLFDNENIQTGSIPADLLSLTGTEIVAHLNSAIKDIYLSAKGVFNPNMLLLPSSLWAEIVSRRMDSGTDTTIFEYLKKNNAYTAATEQPLNIKPIPHLEGAGIAGKGRIMAYELDPENLDMKLPIPWRPLAPQLDGVKIKVPAEYKFSAVNFKQPVAAAYRDLV